MRKSAPSHVRIMAAVAVRASADGVAVYKNSLLAIFLVVPDGCGSLRRSVEVGRRGADYGKMNAPAPLFFLGSLFLCAPSLAREAPRPFRVAYAPSSDALLGVPFSCPQSAPHNLQESIYRTLYR
jgi:hypothetical protein